MTYNTLSVNGQNIFGNSAGEVVTVTFTPLSTYFDTPNNVQINAPSQTVTSAADGTWTVSGLIDPTPDNSGMAWNLQVRDKTTGQPLYSANVQLAYASGSSQHWLSLAPPPAPANTSSFMKAPTGTQAIGLVPVNQGDTTTAWQYQNTTFVNVKNFGAKGNGTTDDTAAIQSAINFLTGAAPPASNTRTPSEALFIPAGTYKITSDLIIRSVSGFRILCAGTELTTFLASGTGFTNAPLFIDGAYKCVFGGFTLKGDGTEQVTDGIRLDWTTAASRSTTTNRFHDIDIRNLNFIIGFSLEGNSTRQVDGTLLDNVLVNGQQVAGSWSNTGNWQKGIAFGDGTFANNYDHVLMGSSPSGCYYGYYNNVSSFALFGAQPASNFCDFWITPGGQTTITNVQSQNSGQLLIAPTSFSPLPNSFNDCQFKTAWLQGAGNAFMTITGGLWNFSNLSATNLQVSNGAYVNGTIAVAGAASSRPAVCNFSNLAVFNTRVACFTGLTNSPLLTVQGYSNYNPNTGNYTYASGDVSSFYQGGSWVNAGGVTVPQVNFISATGNTSYTIPAGAQTLDVTLVAGGSGGGSGALASSGAAGGGAGGSGGGYSRAQLQASQLSGPVTVSVGAGGNGGAAVSSAGAGNPGFSGGTSQFGSYLWAHGAAAGSAGGIANNGSVASAGASGAGMIAGGIGANSVTTAAAGNNSVSGTTSGGGAGGGVVAGPTAEGGGGGGTTWLGSSGNLSTGGVVGGATPSNGSAFIQGNTGPGGGGGAAATSGTAQQGASAQANSGSGGGGGGACSGGTSSGAGGNGGSGFALIIAYFQ